MSVEQALSMVRPMALRLLRHLPAHVDVDDVVQDGVVGLLDAAARFDAAAGATFETFARPRVLGAMLDAQRAAGVRDRRWFTRAGSGRRRPGNAQEPGVFLDLEDARHLASPDPGPEARAETAEAGARLRAAVAMLPPRERAVIESHYWPGALLDDIRAELGRGDRERSLVLRAHSDRKAAARRLSLSRVSQLHQQALKRLRNQLGAL